MEKRALIAVILSILILVVYQYFFMPAPVPKSEVDKRTTMEAGNKTKEETTPTAIPEIIKEDISKIKNITVESDLYTAIFSSRGGTLKSITLKKYKDKGGKPITLKGDEKIPPFSIGVDENFQFGEANFSVKGSDIKLGAEKDKATLVFEYSSGDMIIRRTYTVYNDHYGIDLRDEVNFPYMVTVGKDFGIYEKDESVHYGPVVLRYADRREFVTDKLKEPALFKEGIKWIAQEDKYFFSAIAPRSAVEEAKVWAKEGVALVALKLNSGVNDYLIYAGPKEYDLLKKFGLELEHIVDFGFFSFLARPLFWILKLFYGIFHNYGIAIIFLTIITRIPFIPLINKGQKSMKKLQDIQPKIVEIREKYKKDPQRMQREIMELYKKNKVNPMGGCLPLILQIPVFFALYKILTIAIELRGAPFVLWINDLSVKDPYYILPIVMGATMVIQQKMTPSTMDPTQQKLMMLMPVVFTFLFLTFPSGLVLYWLVNNVLSIAQQWYINRKLQKQPV